MEKPPYVSSPQEKGGGTAATQEETARPLGIENQKEENKAKIPFQRR